MTQFKNRLTQYGPQYAEPAMNFPLVTPSPTVGSHKHDDCGERLSVFDSYDAGREQGQREGYHEGHLAGWEDAKLPNWRCGLWVGILLATEIYLAVTLVLGAKR